FSFYPPQLGRGELAFRRALPSGGKRDRDRRGNSALSRLRPPRLLSGGAFGGWVAHRRVQFFYLLPPSLDVRPAALRNRQPGLSPLASFRYHRSGRQKLFLYVFLH